MGDPSIPDRTGCLTASVPHTISASLHQCLTSPVLFPRDLLTSSVPHIISASVRQCLTPSVPQTRSAGAYLNDKDFNGYTSIHKAVMKEHLPAVTLLLQNKANPKVSTSCPPHAVPTQFASHHILSLTVLSAVPTPCASDCTLAVPTPY